MLSVMTWISNRAHLFRWCLEALKEQDFMLAHNLDTEINVLDDGSTDGLEALLENASYFFGTVNKWTWDKNATAVPRRFNCPAEPYNILVKLCSHEFILKTDPEMVLLDKQFLSRATAWALDRPAIVMPFPYHCYEFDIGTLDDIRRGYKQHHYPTHITEQNAKYEMIYYMALFKKQDYLSLGGIEERFSDGIGSEDNHFLAWWRKEYGMDNFIPLKSPAVHLWHGGMASGPMGVPQHLYSWVNANASLRENLHNTKPNAGREWGRLYEHIKLTRWVGGEKTKEDVPWNQMK
jgi:hypothetical protein